MSEIIELNPMEENEAKPYSFRRLSAVDVFPMFKIIGAIGINEFTACFEKDGIKNMIKAYTSKSGEEGKDEEGKDDEKFSSIVGISVILEIANVIIGNLPKCEKEIYQLLSQTSNLSVEKIKKLDMAVFFEMIIDFVRKDEFKDFIKVVSKLFK